MAGGGNFGQNYFGQNYGQGNQSYPINQGGFQTGGGLSGQPINFNTNTGNFAVETPSGIGTTPNLTPEAQAMITNTGATVTPPPQTNPIIVGDTSTDSTVTNSATTGGVAPYSGGNTYSPINLDFIRNAASRYMRPQNYGISQFSGGPGNFGMSRYGVSSGQQPNYGGGRFQQPFYSSSTRPMGTTAADLDATNRGYGDIYRAYRGMGGTEREFIGSDQFKDFENVLVDQISTLDDRDRLERDLLTQRDRAASGSIYSPSAGRITNAIQRRINSLQQAPRRQESYLSAPSFRPNYNTYQPQPYTNPMMAYRNQFSPQMGYGNQYNSRMGYGNQYNPMMGYGLGGMSNRFSNAPNQFASSMFANVPNYYTRRYNSPPLYSTTPGAYTYGLGSIDNAPTGTSNTGVTGGQDTGKTAQEIADIASVKGGSLFGVDGLVRNPDGSYNYMPTNQEMSAFFPEGGVSLPSSFDVTQLTGYDPAQAEEETTEETTDTGGPDVDTSASDGTVDLTSFGDDNLSLTQQFSKEAASFEGGESAFVNSPRFMEFEGALIRQYIDKSPEEVRAEATRQLERSNAGGIYAPSAKRIYDSLNSYATSRGA